MPKPTASERPWHSLALNRVAPSGWIHSFLQRQRDGLTGHLEHAGYPFDTEGWRADHLPLGARGGSGWWPYEQNAYWIDGMMRCGLLLDDPWLKRKARQSIDHVMSHPDPDGYLGPESLKELKGSERWPHAVFFRAVMADYDDRPSGQTLRRLVRHYVSGTAAHDTARNTCNIEIMAWLYAKTGDPRVRALAESSYRSFQRNESKSGATIRNMLKRDRARDHGPTYMELFKLGAVMYRMNGNRRYLRAAIHAQQKLERDHVLIDGVPSTTEHLRGVYSTAGHETCVISDYLWSLGVLLEATGDARYADAMEVVCFNALPGAVTSDFKALQYFSGPNQVIAGPQTNHHPHGVGGPHVSYRPNPATECCPGNVHRAMPAFAGRMWMEDKEGGIVAALYGPGSARFGHGPGAITVVQSADYPFSERLRFRFSCRKPQRRSFTFRVPAWCANARAWWNGAEIKGDFRPGSFVTLPRDIADGDRLDVDLPRRVTRVRGPENSVGFRWGPLVLSLPIEAKTIIEPDPRSSEAFPARTLLPASPWNFGIHRPDYRGRTIQCRLVLVDLPSMTPGHAGADPGKKRVSRAGSEQAQGEPARNGPGFPWDLAQPPLTVAIPVHRIPGWTLPRKKKLVIKHGDWKKVVEGDLAFTPVMPSEAKRKKAAKRMETVTLVPYGATNLRVTWFPVIP